MYLYMLQTHFAADVAKSVDRILYWIKYYLEAKETGKVVKLEDRIEIPQTGKVLYHQGIVAHLGGDLFGYISQDVTENRRLEDELKNHRNELEVKIAGSEWMNSAVT